jgi:hypothetical protein
MPFRLERKSRMTNPASSTLVTRLLLTDREAILVANGNLDRTCESDRARF